MRIKRIFTSLTITIVLLTAILSSFAEPLLFQESNASKISQNDVVWQRINTKDEEFSVYIPGKLRVFTTGGFSWSYVIPRPIPIISERVVSTYHNRAVFIIKMFETPSPSELIYRYFTISADYKNKPSEITFNGYKGKLYIEKGDTFYRQVQCFSIKQRVYVLEVAARDENNPEALQFMSSLKLGRKKDSPIAPTPITENNATAKPSDIDRSRVYEGKEVNHRAIILYLPFPERTFGAKGTVKLRVVLTHSGDVADILVIKGLNQQVNDRVVELAKSIIFLPAERNGHIVSQYHDVEFSFQ